MEQVILITAYKEFDYLKSFAKYLSENDIGAVIHIDNTNVVRLVHSSEQISPLR